MAAGWQDSWIFRIVDQGTGAGVSGIPVTVLDDDGRAGGYFVSDVDGIVRVPKHDRARLRLRVGLRNEETIELDARALPDDPVPLAAPPDLPLGGGTTSLPAAASPPRPALPPPPPPPAPGHLVRYARIAVLPRDQDIVATPDAARLGGSPSAADPGTIRYGILLETEQIWQSLGAEAGELLYSVSLGPGEEVKLVVSDGRWRKKPDARERPVQIVSRLVGARQLGDGVDAVPLDPCVAGDLETAAAETVQLLAERTARAGEALRRRPVGVREFEGDPPAAGGGGGASVRTLRNMRAEGVLTYHFVEPVERYRVIIRTPRLRPAMLVPFRLPNIATLEVVRRFGHALRRSLLDRALAPDVDQVLAAGEPPAAARQRLFAHIAAHLPHYSATIIAAGDPAERFFALAKLGDAQGRPLTDVIENVVVGRVGNYVAFPLRSLDDAPRDWRSVLGDDVVRRVRASQEVTVTLPIPGTWLRSWLHPAQLATEAGGLGAEAAPETGRLERRKRG